MPSKSTFRGEPEFTLISVINKASTKPVIDDLTRRMTGACRSSDKKFYGVGEKICPGCGARVKNMEYGRLQRVGGSSDAYTHRMTIHFLAFHRDDIPMEVLEEVKKFRAEPVEPVAEELAWPPQGDRPEPPNEAA